MEVHEPFVPTELAEPAFHHLDDTTQVTPETYAHALPSSCGDFTLETIGISDQSAGSCFLKNLDNVNPKRNQLLASHSSAFFSGDKLGVTESEHPIHMFDSSVPISAYPLVPSQEGKTLIDHEPITESSEQHPAKRMRMIPHDDLEEPANRAATGDLHL